MRSKILITALLVAFGLSSVAQDVIETTDGNKIEAKIIEVTDTEVSYKKAANPEGPTYKTGVSNLRKITYENGFVEEYNVAPVVEEEVPVQPKDDEVETVAPVVAAQPTQQNIPHSADPDGKVRMAIFMPAEGATFGFYGMSIKNNKNAGMFWGFRSEFFEIANNVDGQWSKENEDFPPSDVVGPYDSAKVRNSFTLGAVIRLSEDWLFCYVGGGLGTYLHYDLFDSWRYSSPNYYFDEKRWLLNLDKSIVGAEFEGGLVFDFGVVLTAGFTSTNFQKFGWTMGVGFSY